MVFKDLADLAAPQDGVDTRRQALAAGLSVRQVEWRLTSGRWERAHPGAYQTQPGRGDQASAESAAVLACGTGSVLSHWSVAHHLGLARSAPKQFHVSVPSGRSVVKPLGVTVYRTVGAVDASEPWLWPPRTSVDRTVLDIAALGTADDARRARRARLPTRPDVARGAPDGARAPCRPSMGRRSARCP
jgi:predicted transcriptional regulator of viral defense system